MVVEALLKWLQMVEEGERTATVEVWKVLEVRFRYKRRHQTVM